MSELSDELKQNIDRNPAVFESYIMAALIGSHSFFLQHGYKICPIRPRINERRKDFSHNWLNVLYEALCVYWQGQNTTINENPIPRAALDIYLNEASDRGRILDKEIEDLDVGLVNIYSLVEVNIEATMTFVESGVLSRWLGIRLAQEWSKDAVADPNILTPERIAEWHDELQRIPAEDDDGSIVTVSDTIRNTETRGELYTLPELPALSKAVGGGFAKGEHTLIAATTGGGKTVLAMQMAATWASIGINVTVVTTEQKPAQLMHRAYSCMNNIPFEFFTETDDICPETKLPMRVTTDGEWMEGVHNFRAHVENRLTFLDWSGSRKTIVGDLASNLDKLKRAIPNYETDILIFDWIGASLQRGAKVDAIRHLYNDVAAELKVIAVEKNLCVFSFAQLNKQLTKNSSKPDHTMLHECKSLPDQCVNALYLSSIKNNREEEEAYTRMQFINVAKSRFGPGGHIKVARDFQYQRFSPQ
mgnify:CR=1 FL=1|jgi:replicative DNA helicase